jgi:hypothetical protein
MNGNPLKEPRAKKSDDGHLKKPKPKITAGAAKAIADIKTAPDIPWIERWIEDLCRTYSYPLQLICSDFIGRLGGLLEAQESIRILEKLRMEYKAHHPFSQPVPDDYSFLDTIPEPIANDC